MSVEFRYADCGAIIILNVLYIASIIAQSIRFRGQHIQTKGALFPIQKMEGENILRIDGILRRNFPPNMYSLR